MNPLFRKSLYQCKSGINNEIVFELQKLFSSMELGKKVFQDTTSLCKLMNIDINYQQDGCEFWKLLVTTLEEQGVEVPFFKGKQTYVTECEVSMIFNLIFSIPIFSLSSLDRSAIASLPKLKISWV